MAFGISAGAAALIGVGGASLIGAAMGADASRSAANTQADASREATSAQKAMYDQTRQDNMPMMDARNASLAKLRSVLGIDGSGGLSPDQVMNDPGYKFGMDQGLRTMNNQATAHGMRNSGAALKAATRYGNDYATTKYDAAFNRIVNPLQSMAGLGQSGANSIAAAGQNYVNQAGQNMIGAGNAQAASTMASANGWANAGNQLAGWYANSQRANPLSTPQSAWSSSGGWGSGDAFGNQDLGAFL